MSVFVGDGRTQLVDPANLRSVDKQRRLVIRALPSPRKVQVATADALDLVLASDVAAGTDLPAFTNSAMDGWAVVAADVAAATGDTPVALRDGGRVHAGPTSDEGADSVTAGTTVAVMTGAPLPDGADAVVPVEHTTGAADGAIAMHVAVEPGRHVRSAGEEISAGTVLLRAGHRITAADIGVLVATGVDQVTAVARPRVGILTTGDELVPAGTTLEPGQIHDSNGPMLAAMVADAGADPVRRGPIPDTMTALTRALEDIVDDVDVVIMSGGVSAGERDHVAAAIGQLGEVERTRLAMRPGMPQALGRIGSTTVIGLPGNPVSSFVSFEVLVRPALRLLAGRKDVLRPSVTGVLDEAVTSPEGKLEFVRVRLARRKGTWHATLAGGQGSHMIGALSRADALAEVPEDATELAAGSSIRLHLLVS
ncbi:MAG TPA: gephyrin-like molybdotransferase Glp [Nitriliruptoraceae bacterium]|nr:gephyrin-like molybdotransferase Glp [Nitriliruptoraceae bacterium]